MTLVQLAEWLFNFGANVLTILGVLRANTDASAQESFPFTLQAYVIANNHALVVGDSRLDVLRTDLEAIDTRTVNIGTKVDEIYTLVAALGGPVTLPDPAPAGYGGVSGDDVTEAVWNVADDPAWGSNTMGGQFVHSNRVTFNMSRYTLHTPWPNALFWMYGPFDVPSGSVSTDVPPVDLTTVVPGDTALTWLNREAPTFSWIEDGTFGPFPYALSLQNGQFIWVLKYDTASWSILMRELFPSSPSGSGWPGLANVALGAPVAIADVFTVDGPMDGVLVDITAAPTRQGFFLFGTVRSWRNIGAVAFVSDNGDQELPQTLGFTNAVYAPRTIVQPSSLVGRASAGVTGTVTPWTRI